MHLGRFQESLRCRVLKWLGHTRRVSYESGNCFMYSYKTLNSPVPRGMGTPIMIHSLTPRIGSRRPRTAASNKWSASIFSCTWLSEPWSAYLLFSQMMLTWVHYLSFWKRQSEWCQEHPPEECHCLDTAGCKTLKVIVSASSMTCRMSTWIPCPCITWTISFIIVCLAASIPKICSTSAKKGGS